MPWTKSARLQSATLPKTPTPIDPSAITLPDLLDAACNHAPNATALNQSSHTGWQSLSNQVFREQCRTVAQGLLSLNLHPGDRIALLTHNDTRFAIADMGSLMAGLVNVPIDLTQTLENIIFILQHSEAKLLWVAQSDWLEQFMPYLEQLPALQYVVVEFAPESELESGAELEKWQAINAKRHFRGTPLPHPCCLISLPALQTSGQVQGMTGLEQVPLPTLSAQDLATIIYIPSASGELMGVMLSHRNLAGNALAAFASLSGLQCGAEETVLSFLPLTHVFARCLLYGHIYYGHSIYFSTPSQVLKHLKQVQPTILATVPIFLERIFNKFLEWGQQVESKWKQRVFAWTLRLMHSTASGQRLSRHHTVFLRLADRLVLSKWRSLFGGRIKYILCGGAALKAELVRGFAVAGVTVLQGYGLTQAGIVSCNRAEDNRAGTVGAPIPGMEVAIASDSEILVRGDFITSGYYKNSAATLALIDAQGWLHTGDLGHFTEDGLLQITGIKKPLFKLSTGKYIAPQPIEARLMRSPFVSKVQVVGADHKYCSALILPNWSALNDHLQLLNLDDENLLQHSCTLALYQAVVDAANCHLPYWALVKQFRLISPHSDFGKEWLNGNLNRNDVVIALASDINDLYREKASKDSPKQVAVTDREMSEVISEITCPIPPAVSCPTYAQSLNIAR
ncbi:AMP-dependent synthetase/ligase [Leptolyngbya ohadii]|uniref:AMP-dependent synthetase/ligase n=1 Tax=Leptolyngbya ohadii TaxID=1962290 RepID=UPI000B5A0E98|nr:AMP-binding protein [Leptolyngbya ohadii]